MKFCSIFNILYDIITSKLKISEKYYVKEKFETKVIKKLKMKYILGTGAILVSTTLLPKVLKKTTNYLYKKQLKINNQQHHSVSWEDELIKKLITKRIKAMQINTDNIAQQCINCELMRK